MADLTTKAKVKAYLGISASTYDTFIDSLITAYSAKVERFCNRNFERDTYTEYFDTDFGDRKIFLRNTPVISLTSVSYKQGNFGNPTYIAYNSNDYLLKDSQIVSFGVILPEAEQFVKAVYVGGYLIDFANEDSDTHTLPFDLTQAVTELVANVYKEKDSEGVLSETTEGQSVTFKDVTINKRMSDKLLQFRHKNI